MSTNTYVRYVRRIGFLFDTLELKPEYKITPRVERKGKKESLIHRRKLSKSFYDWGMKRKSPSVDWKGLWKLHRG